MTTVLQSRVQIRDVELKDIFGWPLKVARRDDDGEIIWTTPPGVDGRGVADTEKATASMLIRDVLLSINNIEFLRRMQKAKDGYNAQRLWGQVENSHGKETVSLREDQYKWLHSFLGRKVALTKEGKDQSLEERTVAVHLWGVHEWYIRKQLMSMEDAKELDMEQDSDEGDETK